MDYSKNLLIDRNGKAIDASIGHDEVCRTKGNTLDQYLKTGGARTHIFRERLDVEIGMAEFSEKQIKVICQVVRKNCIYSAVVSRRGLIKEVGDNIRRVSVSQIMKALV